MSDSLIEQVKRLAEAKKSGEQASCYSHSRTIVSCIADDTDFVALLAHMQAQQAVVDAAREYRQVERDIRIGSAGMLNAKLAMHALDAALEKESNGKG